MTMGTADLAPDVSPDDAEIRWTDSGRPFVRTPDECFVDLPYYPWAPNYAEVDRMRMHYVFHGQFVSAAVSFPSGALRARVRTGTAARTR